MDTRDDGMNEGGATEMTCGVWLGCLVCDVPGYIRLFASLDKGLFLGNARN